MPGENHIYNAADIARYRSGKMTDAEMHAIEKAAARDPFLADAIEGYAFTETPEKDVTFLTEKIAGASGQRRGQLIPMWLKVAAVLLIIMGGAYLTWMISGSEEPPHIAQEQNESETRDAQTLTQSLEKDTSIHSTPELANTKTEKNDIPEQKPAKIQSRSVNLTPNDDDKVYTQLSPSLAEDKFLSGDTSKQFLTKAAEDTKRADSIGDVVVKANGIKREQKELSREMAKSKAEKDMPSQKIDEVQVTSTNRRNQGVYSNSATRNKQEVLKLNYNDSAQAPMGGWANFRQYVFENLEVPKNDKGEIYNGVVVLSFEVNKKGDPKNVRVEESLCKICDNEATRLLENGPRWKYGRERRSLEIKF